MKNLVFCAYAFIENYSGSVNLPQEKKKERKNRDTYYKNICVALYSAKKLNPDDDVALVTNDSVPKEYLDFFESNEIMVIHCDYNQFKFSSNYKWSLAFYKLCALDYVSKIKEYDNFMLLDTDTLAIRNFGEMWKEAEQNILLYDIQHSLNHPAAKGLRAEYFELLDKKSYLTNWGGEFICINKKFLTDWIIECKKIYKLLLSETFETNYGDEFITYIVAEKFKENVKSGNAYLFRFWTGRFYLVSTNYFYNQIAILHVPSEKNTGMLSIYKYIVRNKKLPSVNRTRLMLNLPSYRVPLKHYIITLLQKINII